MEVLVVLMGTAVLCAGGTVELCLLGGARAFLLC